MPAQAINRCTTPNGVVLITDEPCDDPGQKDSIPSSGSAPLALPPAAPAAPVAPASITTPVVPPKQAPVASQEPAKPLSRKQEIALELARADKEIGDLKQNLEYALNGLRTRKPRSNRRGVTVQEDIAAEMKKVTAGYESNINLIQMKKQQLEREQKALAKKS